MKQAFSKILVLWAGLILGVSFIAAPAKFLVEELSRELNLMVGRANFNLFNKVEWLLLLSLIVILFISKKSADKFQWILVSVLFIFLTLDSFILLPALSDYIDALVAGVSPEKTIHHTIYIVIDIMKLGLIFFGQKEFAVKAH